MNNEERVFVEAAIPAHSTNLKTIMWLAKKQYWFKYTLSLADNMMIEAISCIVTARKNLFLEFLSKINAWMKYMTGNYL